MFWAFFWVLGIREGKIPSVSTSSRSHDTVMGARPKAAQFPVGVSRSQVDTPREQRKSGCTET